MAKLPPRNRVIYQSEALFISPDATGKHIYYMPPLSANSVTEAAMQEELLMTATSKNYISGSGAAGSTVVFDACAGTGVTTALDYKFKMFDCTGTVSGSSGFLVDHAGARVTNAHAVLADDGLLSGISGNTKALAKMTNGVLGS